MLRRCNAKKTSCNVDYGEISVIKTYVTRTRRYRKIKMLRSTRKSIKLNKTPAKLYSLSLAWHLFLEEEDNNGYALRELRVVLKRKMGHVNALGTLPRTQNMLTTLLKLNMYVAVLTPWFSGNSQLKMIVIGNT